MLYYLLTKIPFKGKLTIIDSMGVERIFGTKTSNFPSVKIRLKNKLTEFKLLYNPSLYLGEEYMKNNLTIEKGTLEDFINIITESYYDFHKVNFIRLLFDNFSTLIRSLQQFNDLIGSKKNVAHHYDIDEKLYNLFLDKDMQYSCGYFHNNNISLENSQLDKKNHIIKKLNIEKGMSVLDIGSGWGGLAIQIAKNTGAKVTGITLSKNQLETAKKRAEEEGLSDQVNFKFQDYRTETNKYDRIVSVGMFEHVGINYFSKFFSKCNDLLKDNGVMLLHTIGYKGKPAATNPWIRKYIFPGGYIPSLSEILHSTEKNNMLITDIEILRLHYAETLKHWHRNIQKNKEKIISIFDEKFYRMWKFYLVSSEYSFRNMGNVNFQIQISKKINNLPLTRNYIYN
ncbi:MAG: Cyclopropane-fatty-acyl-phospholipid synthase [Alphaproteobacteria bacterium MarineAlpha5_Bin9]|nr:MAG: Cyclopropane-fatty-acyl-phospholipid synthase [Alphaproteobacteria bacterium MarineAlpha5_Bin9]|tara:strand:+ start:6946 stop:8139 length:1194 start_codon:yes stop_codon:yes gene_type:complete